MWAFTPHPPRVPWQSVVLHKIAKAKRRATWDRKREEKLANMHPEKAAKVRKQAESAAKRLQERGPRNGYAEYQAKRREEVREERRARGWLG